MIPVGDDPRGRKTQQAGRPASREYKGVVDTGDERVGASTRRERQRERKKERERTSTRKHQHFLLGEESFAVT